MGPFWQGGGNACGGIPTPLPASSTSRSCPVEATGGSAQEASTPIVQSTLLPPVHKPALRPVVWWRGIERCWPLCPWLSNLNWNQRPWGWRWVLADSWVVEGEVGRRRKKIEGYQQLPGSGNGVRVS